MDVNETQIMFLDIIRSSLTGETTNKAYSDIDTEQLMRLAEIHRILPLVCDCIYAKGLTENLEGKVIESYRFKAVKIATREIVKSHEFIDILNVFKESGLEPTVVKGIVCRNMYPKWMLRPSVDEDLLVNPEEMNRYHDVLIAEGLYLEQKEEDIASNNEISYRKENSPIFIEIHPSLFPVESEAYGHLNKYFQGSAERNTVINIDGLDIRTLSSTDHLLYLILHVYKHFVHSGFGIRQVCDIMIMSMECGSEIDWEHIKDVMNDIHATEFLNAIYNIGYKYLGFDAEKAHISAGFINTAIDERPLLEDIIIGGLYGASVDNRIHSSNMMLSAITSRKSRGLLRSLFPSYSYMSSQFEYVRRFRFMLPFGYVHRIFRYLFGNEAHNINETIEIGNQRVALLKFYDMIK